MVGSCCAIVGVLIISLPIPIIVNTFNKLYEKAKIKNQILKKKKLAGWTDYKKTGFTKVSGSSLASACKRRLHGTAGAGAVIGGTAHSPRTNTADNTQPAVVPVSASFPSPLWRYEYIGAHPQPRARLVGSLSDEGG